MEKCYLCNSREQDEIKYGEFMTRNGISVHYFCLLLTSNLLQRGRDDEGFLGFLLVDIEKEAVRVAPATCYYCKKKGANIACCANKCRRSFHLICGINNDCQNQFVGTFMSFCDRHVAKKKDRGPQKNEICCICYDDLRDRQGKYNSVTMLQAPCCKNGWFHKWCLASFAKSAGYFFRCPLCNDSKKFRQRLVYKGIFIPDRDASWELEPNAFSELLERPKICSAVTCNAKGGRASNPRRNKLVVCLACGSVAIHRCCIENKTDNFYCNDCQKTFAEVNDTTVVNMSASNNTDSDEEEDVDVCGEDDGSSNLNPMEIERNVSPEELIRPTGRVKSNILSIADDDESSIEGEISDTEDGVIPRSKFSRQHNRQTFADIGDEIIEELEKIPVQAHCRSLRRIESSDSGSSIDNVPVNPKRITSQDSESFFDSGAGSDRSDSSTEKSNIINDSNNGIKETTSNQTEKSKRRLLRYTSLNNEPIEMKETSSSQTEKSKRRVRRYTSLNSEPKGDWCVAKRTRRQSMHTDINTSIENTDKSNKCSYLTQSSSITTHSSTTTPIESDKPPVTIVRKDDKLKKGFKPEAFASKTTEKLAMKNRSRKRKTRSRTQSEECPKISNVTSASQRRSSLQNTSNTIQDQTFEVLSNKRMRSVSQSSNEFSQNKKQRNDNALNENENDYINTVSIPTRRSSRSRSPLGLHQSSINAFITPAHIKEKQAQKDAQKEEENSVKIGTLEPRIEKIFGKNQTNISSQNPKRQKPEACIHRNDSNSSSVLNNSANKISKMFSYSFDILLSSSKKKRGRKPLSQRFSEQNLPSSQTRIESFFKRI